MANQDADVARQLGRFEKATLLLQIHALQSLGHIPGRNDRKGIDVLLVETGLTQTDVAWLLGKTKQAVSAAIQRADTQGPSRQV